MEKSIAATKIIFSQLTRATKKPLKGLVATISASLLAVALTSCAVTSEQYKRGYMDAETLEVAQGQSGPAAFASCTLIGTFRAAGLTPSEFNEYIDGCVAFATEGN